MLYFHLLYNERSNLVFCSTFIDVYFIIWNILREAVSHNNMNHFTLTFYFPLNWKKLKMYTFNECISLLQCYLGKILAHNVVCLRFICCFHLNKIEDCFKFKRPYLIIYHSLSTAFILF
jgi:hypothetical protein